MTVNRSRVSPLNRSEWAFEFDRFDTRSSLVETPRQLSPVESSQPKPTESSKNLEIPRDSANTDGRGCSLCSTWPRTFAFITALCLLCAAAVLIPLVLTNTLGVATKITSGTSATSITSTSITTSSTTTTTITSETTTTSSSSTSTTTTTRLMCTIGCANTSTSTASRLAFYSFDGNANDIHGVYSATASGSPTYVTGYVTSAISFDAPSTQRLSAPSMSFNSRSFTIEFWFYSSVLIGYNYALFGQLSSINTAKQTLFVVLNNGRMGLGFYNDDTYSNRVFSASTWYHVALVYDNNVRQRFIYIDGVLDAQSAFNVGPYLGTSGTVTIGGADIYGGYGILYSTAVMDLLSVSTRAKSTCEIYNDATLAAYLPFDGSVVDGGPNVVPVTSSAVSFTTGVINQGVSFSGSSYVQIGSLTGLGRTNYPFSIAFWVYPIVYGSLVHVSTGSNGLGWCAPFIGFNGTGQIIAQVYSSSPYIIRGPVIQMNVWTHIIQTYSPTNGHRLYVNGQIIGSISSGTYYVASSGQNFMTIGHRLSSVGTCSNPGILDNPFQGMIDEFRVYSRELSTDDVCLLAWP